MKHFTLMIFILTLFSGCENKNSDQKTETRTPYSVQCKNPLIPEFTLNYDSNPSQQEVNALCDCLWDKLVGWEKETMIKLTTGKKDEVNSLHMTAFPARFGKRLNECGGDKL